MATVTEGYVEAQAGRIKAEADTETAKALLTLQESAKRDLLWTLGFTATMIAIATGVILAVLT